MSITQTIRRTAELLQNSDSPLLDAKVLMGFALNLDEAALIAEGERDLTADEQLAFTRAVGQRLEGKPVSQIIGEKEFWSLTFKVTPDTLTPRPDSEAIIEEALSTGLIPSKILDIGTGTGCLLAALLTEFKSATGIAVDISPGALEVAQDNFEALDLLDRAEIMLSDGAERVLSQKFDLIVSNPPYIAYADMDNLPKDVRNFEPGLALFAENQGLGFYQRFAQELPPLLNPGGVLLFEVGQGQADNVAQLLADAMGEKSFQPLKRQDLAGIERVVGLKRL